MHSLRIGRFCALVVMSGGLLLLGCSDYGTSGPAPVTSVEVSPDSPSIDIGESIQLSAATRVGNTVVTGRAVTWSSDDDGVATVTSTGLVEGIAAGSTLIRAKSESITGTAQVTVNPVP